MKAFSALTSLALVAVSQAHTIFQKISIDGVEQGQLRGVRAPDGPYSTYPIQDLTDPNMACNTGIVYKDDIVHQITAGSTVGAWWGHVIGGPQWPVDPDNPISPGHKGPISVYLAKVDDAVTADGNGLQWFKIAHDGLIDVPNGKWAVDTMIENKGWNYFKVPSCVAPGNYLLRVELLALHSAYAAGGAQFFMECAQVNIVSNGTHTGAPYTTFPGAYYPEHPGILINIYDQYGQPTNAKKEYTIPGPEPISCPSD
ncbi:family 61 glycosyl hydrolase [Pluteus cervinus]|uniref:Family 61 glycosyl hydrolase n=1 Tax=Pluteus cervinus TaxID=181527 RepID=A0ACD3AVG6_9AGAR|nr:family 61 glycosyl hydrolase [Pluteus cervinus]